MAYFAKIDDNNIVEQVHIVSDDVAITEEAGITFLKEFLGSETNWKQTFKDGTRKNYAGIGHTYDVPKDAFIPPQPWPSWTLNEDTCNWDAPTAYPDDGKPYTWNEGTTSWDEVSE